MSFGGYRLMERLSTRHFGWLPLVISMAFFAGCNGFSVRGPRDPSSEGGFFGWHFNAPFDTSEVKTVFVQFKSQTFRRDVQLRLAEAVQKEISMRSPYRVVGSPAQADSILS